MNPHETKSRQILSLLRLPFRHSGESAGSAPRVELLTEAILSQPPTPSPTGLRFPSAETLSVFRTTAVSLSLGPFVRPLMLGRQTICK